MRTGQATERVYPQLKRQGFTPDAVLAHPGWGDTLYLRDVYPDIRHGENGWLVDFFDYPGIAERIVETLNDPATQNPCAGRPEATSPPVTP